MHPEDYFKNALIFFLAKTYGIDTTQALCNTHTTTEKGW
jgi:hypothetical protein